MKKCIIFILTLSAILFFNCKSQDKPVLVSEISSEVIECLKANSKYLIMGNLKGVEALDLYGKELDFYKAR